MQARPSLRLSSTATLLLWLTAACGPIEAPGPSEPGTQTRALASTNGLAFNGLAFNGLAFNGLAFNGLSTQALSGNIKLSSWFQENPALANMVMTYVVRCAVPAGQVRTYSHAGVTYTWPGSLGLAPDWANGKRPTVAEQQLVSACLAAHGNKYGVTIPLSVLGLNARKQVIPYTGSELETFNEREACFFGNLFAQEGVFVGNDRFNLDERESTARACALTDTADAVRNACPPLIFTGTCQSHCTLDASRLYYTRCTINGTHYLPITTRMRGADIYQCGDGTCQFTETCGTGHQYDNCGTDCGACPIR